MSTLDERTEDFLENLVLDYMQSGGMFTSLDIANQAKVAGHRVRNYQVADWLRKNVIVLAHAGGYLYNQSLITVDSKAVGITLAYLYHHYQDDPDTYLDRDQNPKSFLKPTVSLGFPAALQSSSVVYFPTREQARVYARNSNYVYKFKDQGHNSPYGERWSCVEA